MVGCCEVVLKSKAMFPVTHVERRVIGVMEVKRGGKTQACMAKGKAMSCAQYK